MKKVFAILVAMLFVASFSVVACKKAEEQAPAEPAKVEAPAPADQAAPAPAPAPEAAPAPAPAPAK